MRIIRLNQTGITHWIIPVVVMLIVGGIGVYTVTKSRAYSSWTFSCVGISAPSSVAYGGWYTAKVTYKNTGGSTWTGANSYSKLSIGTGSPYKVVKSVNASTYKSVAPGQTITITHTFQANMTRGGYSWASHMWQKTSYGSTMMIAGSCTKAFSIY